MPNEILALLEALGLRHTCETIEEALKSAQRSKPSYSTFLGAAAAFAMIPPHSTVPDFRAYQNKVSENLAAAIKESNIRYVVHLSSVGAELGEKTGPVNGLHDSETRLNALPRVNIVH